MRAVGARRRQVALVYVRTAAAARRARRRRRRRARDRPLEPARPLLRLHVLGGRRRLRRRRDRRARQRRWSACSRRRSPRCRRSAAASAPTCARRSSRRARRSAARTAATACCAGCDFLPRTMQIGLRGVGRRKRRSLATVLIVALAVGNLLAVLGLAAAVTQTDARRVGRPPRGRPHLDDRARAASTSAPAEAIRSTPGVAEAQPALVNDVELAGEEAFVWGVVHEPLFRYRLSDGRWFSAGRGASRREPVAVIERNLARITGVEVGDRVTRRHGGRAGRPSHRRDRREPAGERHGAVRPAHDDPVAPRPAGRREHVLDPDDLVRPRARRPDDDARSRTASRRSATRSAARSRTSPSATTSPRTGRSRRRSPCSAS